MTAESRQPLFDLKDRVVVLTGGLGQLGREFCRALVDHGARVAVIDTDTWRRSPMVRRSSAPRPNS